MHFIVFYRIGVAMDINFKVSGEIIEELSEKFLRI
jgi:hypothetical protein